MDYKMEIITLLLCVVPEIVTSITVYSNGNSPEVKLKGGMMVDVHKEFVPVTSKYKESTVKNRVESVHTHRNNNSTKLSINERYRRLIPYMTFYYANDLAVPTPVATKDVEIKKAQIIQELHTVQRDPKKIVYSHQNIPRYQGNRLTQHNIASANPNKLYYNTSPVYQSKIIQNYNPLLSEYKIIIPNDYDSGRFIPRQTQKNLSIFGPQTRKPFLNLFNEDTANIQYYLSEKDQSPKYKLVPYEQRSSFHTASQHENRYDITKKPVPISVSTPKDQVYLKPRPTRPHYLYDVNVQPTATRKQPTTVSEDYFEKQRPPSTLTRPVIQSGFRPIVSPPSFTTESQGYLTSTTETIISDTDYYKQHELNIAMAPVSPSDDFKPNYYEYIVEQNTFKPPQTTTASTITLASLLDSLQLNKSIPRPITKENVGSSIKTLLQVLNALRAMPSQTDIVDMPVLSTPTPFVAPKVVADIPAKSVEPNTEPPRYVNSEDLHEAPHLAQVNVPSQHLDDDPSDGGTSQQFPPPIMSDDEGGTPGRPGVDYPILTVIPQTKFSCKTQRYKGFFADTETRCQNLFPLGSCIILSFLMGKVKSETIVDAYVATRYIYRLNILGFVWHYCDLNGGQASFLCPNGTVFSQAGLTCDWWYNVRCSSTTQLYVLNESLYKYILPHSPKFPEDYSGPLVDKYLTLKFKEMEEQFKKNKNKQISDKMDSGEDSSEDTDEKDKVKDEGENETSKPSVIVESPGTSGKVQRLEE